MFVVIVPIIVSVFALFMQSNNVIEKGLKLFGIHRQLLQSTAWDFVFSGWPEGPVEIKLRNGKSIYGVLSIGAFVTYFYDGRDIYLKEEYQRENNKIVKISKTQGIYVDGTQIAFVRFMKKDWR